ncbi:ClbS/DfsB family four-helix bundle protein [Rhodococcus tibetensis]|uniref:ClbS/DfsB family four-helix bundle protein n=1 Tax=Rhodococcus tibetensis TaxID=2965064 RepID=A0ABT1Q6U9_9NOCA|nr:ClbS/DfsB family four-helix bundle protein [Rhodococcus sp. FXJ9.536]MCQ4117961.1 ClbS/DfsB family four-helix bundle protein [Rhodococcus sp. FXJ9.536]
MAVPNDKASLLTAIDANYIKLVADLARVPPERSRERSLPGHSTGTLISPADLVAYLIGWNELVLTWHHDRALGIEPEFPATGYTWSQLGELAQSFYRNCASESWAELLERLSAAESRIVALIDSMSNEELYAKPWYKKYTAGRMIQLNTASPYSNARGRIRKWLRSQHEPR